MAEPDSGDSSRSGAFALTHTQEHKTMEAPGGALTSPPRAYISPTKRRSSLRGSLSGNKEHGVQGHLERSAVGILILRVDGTEGPTLHKVVPDYEDEPNVQPNPYVEEMLREASKRLQECLPETDWTFPRPRDDWVSLLKRPAGASVAPSAVGDERQSTADTGSAEIYYLAPRPNVVPDCSYFVLHIPPPEESSQLPTPPEQGGVADPPNPPGLGRTWLRRRRIYGICRRAPSHLPWATVLVSALPCFGILRHQFMSVTSVFFDKHCEDDHDFSTFLMSISQPTTGTLHREAGLQSYGDLPVMWLVSPLGIEHVLGLVKLLLLEGRILFFSSNASKATTAVLSLLTLVPGLYNQALGHEDHTTTQVYGYRWKKFGMPLHVFNEGKFFMEPLLVMSQAEKVFQTHPSFLVGTSNAMVSRLPAAQLDAIVDLDQCQIDSQRFADGSEHGQKDLASVAFEFGPADATFIEEVMDSLPSKNSPMTEADSLNDNSEWDGSDSWIRKHFQSYFERFLSEASHALHQTKSSSASSSSSWVAKAVSGLTLTSRRTFDARMSSYNSAWVELWTNTANYTTWQHLYPHPCLQEELDKTQRVQDEPKAPSDGFVNFTYSNGDTYIGTMVAGKRHGRGAYIEHSTGNTYEGDWKGDRRHGKGILTTGASDFLYDGDWVDDKRTGRGHCTIRGRETYTGEWRDNKFDGQGKYVDSEGNVYEGEWSEGRKHGAGTYRKVNGDVYVGEYRAGLRCGVGQCNYADGSVYAGQWADGKRQGEGTLVSSNGKKYEGMWRDNKRDGWGVYTSALGDLKEGEWVSDQPKDGEWKISYSNGDQFVGRCKNGRPHGYGVCKFANMDVYTGEWEDGLRSGRGVCIYASGDKFDGMWSCNQPLENDYNSRATHVVPLHVDGQASAVTQKGVGSANDAQRGVVLGGESASGPQTELEEITGHASIVYPSGDKYVGDLVKGKRHGKGAYFERASGNKYEGEWKDDQRHGRGVLTSGSNDFSYDGEWVEDKRTGQGHCTIRGRESYTGSWLNGKFHGNGKYVDSDGNTYDGEWADGTKDGAGTLTKTDGEVYVGEFVAGQRAGKGQCTYSDGSVYSGEWRDDRYNGEGTLMSASGDKHEGVWSEGRRNGWGIWTSPTGDVVEGMWYQDEPKDGEWKITYSNGDQFVGRCRDGRPNGYGVCKYANGAVFTGEWLDGLRHGQGVCVFANGEVYDGHWQRDHVSLTGVGTLKFQDGRVHEFS